MSAEPEQLELIKTGPLSKGYRRTSFLFRRQGGLCSICAGPMLLINLMAMKPGERKKMRKREPFTWGLMASIDHEIPASVRRGIAFNCRAAHRACNELKGSQLIQGYPLECYEPQNLRRNYPRIYLHGGASLELIPPT